MATKISAWISHDWVTRDLELEPGVQLVQHICRACSRNFVDELGSNRRYAVHVGATHFDRLSDETTASWLAAPCPGERLKSDAADLETRFHARTYPNRHLHFGVFDTAEKCEAAKIQAEKSAEENNARSACIAADDPRLREN
jgi:hypothetical protein